jgi:ABC-type multidrug transport system fused ATPase/permease subunit
VVVVVFLQIFLGILDLIGIAAVGILGALAVSGVESSQPGNRVSSVLKLLQISGQPFQSQAAILGITAAALLITRTAISAFFVRRTLYFLSRRGAVISSELIAKVLSQPLTAIQSKASQEVLYSVTRGVFTVTMGVIGTVVTLISDFSLLIVVLVGLFVVDHVMAIGTIFLFGFVGFLMYWLLQVRARELGVQNTELNIQSNEKIIEVLNSYRESVVKNRRAYYANSIGKLRLDLANTEAEMTFMPNVSKYVLETTVVIGALLICAMQFLLRDASHAVATLAVFMAAGTRIAPAVLRIQQGALQIRGNIGSAAPTLELIHDLRDLNPDLNYEDEPRFDHKDFLPTIQTSNVTLTYENRSKPAVNDVSFKIKPGSSLAIVGSSGAGKTSLADLLLGIIEPNSGEILISGKKPSEAVIVWPGAIAYVPQDALIVNGSIKENVALGFNPDNVEDSRIWKALETARLSEYVRSLPDGINSPVGERGAKLSGGQRQRLGIARAMFTEPKLLVMDESTSALDGQTELGITDSIAELRGDVTVVIIAHRLSTVRFADRLIYLSEGKLIASGTFEEVRVQVPDFDEQARLMGL